MLESMVHSRLPTRAEATDVANAIWDGTDAVMLSAESAVGRYPVEAVAMLARIATAVEPAAPRGAGAVETCWSRGSAAPDYREVVARAVAETFDCTGAVAVLVPTLSGSTARSVARYRLPGWVVAVSPHRETCQRLLLSRGVWPEWEPERPDDWREYARAWLRRHGLPGRAMLLTEGPSPVNPRANHRMEILELGEADAGPGQ
jgi:pyruvate kinase